MKKLRHLLGFPKGRPLGNPIGQWVPYGKKGVVDPGDGTRYLANDYFSHDYMGNGYI